MLQKVLDLELELYFFWKKIHNVFRKSLKETSYDDLRVYMITENE